MVLYYLVAVLWYICFVVVLYALFIAPRQKKYIEKMQLIDVVENGGSSLFFEMWGGWLFLILMLACCFILIPIEAFQFISGKPMGIGSETEFIFRKENGEVVSLNIKATDFKFICPKAIQIGDLCSVASKGKALLRVKPDDDFRLRQYQQNVDNNQQNGQ